MEFREALTDLIASIEKHAEGSVVSARKPL